MGVADLQVGVAALQVRVAALQVGVAALQVGVVEIWAVGVPKVDVGVILFCSGGDYNCDA